MCVNRWAVVLLCGLAILIAACSDDDQADAVPPAPDAPAESTPEPTSSEAPTSTPTAPADRDTAGAVDAWIAMWDGAELVITDSEAAEAAITAVATNEIYESLDRLFNPDVSTEEGLTPTPRSFENNPVVSEQDDGSALINDCLFVNPLETAPSVWYSGVARFVDDGWRIEELTPEFLQGCSPAVMTEAVIEGYDAYWDARLEFWDPPDPDHPLVDATTTGGHNEFLVGLLATDRDEGRAVRGRSENFPEIIEVRSPFEVVIFDCQLQDPGRGLFDLESGERLPGINPIVEGQKDVVRVTMRLADDTWKVEDVQGQANRICEHAPTTQALPSI